MNLTMFVSNSLNELDKRMKHEDFTLTKFIMTAEYTITAR